MKKYFLGLALFLMPFNSIGIPEIPEMPEVNIREQKSSFATYSDSEHNNEEVNFYCGQAVYIRAKIKSEAKPATILTLLDEKKQETLRLTMTSSQEEYIAQIKAPSNPGIYYLHLEIKGEGLSFSGERNINVFAESQDKAGFSNSKVETKAESIVQGKDIDAQESDREEGFILDDKKEMTKTPFNFLIWFWTGLRKIVDTLKILL